MNQKNNMLKLKLKLSSKNISILTFFYRIKRPGLSLSDFLSDL